MQPLSSMRAVPRVLLFVATALTLTACDDDGPTPMPTLDVTDVSAPPETTAPQDTQSGPNRPPELERIGDRVAPVGRLLVITVVARDPDGDPLTYSVFGNLPEGARFDKHTGRFEWTPVEAGRTVFLTFVVSDGVDFDRETVRIQIVEALTEEPPVFVPVGDQAVPVDADFQLRVEATDPNGGAVTYGSEEGLPAGASLDAQSGILRWRPTGAQAGEVFPIVFTASDGAASASMRVQLVVDDGREGLQLPPRFSMSKSAIAVAGQALTLNIGVSDPNADPLTVSLLGEMPEGAAIVDKTFTWTPAPDLAGQVVNLPFTAKDGTFTAVHVVAVTIQRPPSDGCPEDPREPNDTFATAARIEPGTLSGVICDGPTTADLDYFRIAVPASSRLQVELSFDARDGDLDLYLLDAAESVLAASEGITGTERVSAQTTAATDLVIAVIGFSDVPLVVPYTLTVTVTDAEACVDDPYAGNHTPETARPFTAAISASTLQLCAGHPDYWTFEAACGQRIEVIMAIGNDEDLDMYVYDSPDFSGPSGRTPIGAATGETSFESIDIPSTDRDGLHLLEVVSYPNNTVSAPYELVIETSGGCTDDGRANHAPASAAPLDADAEGTLCCRPDYFRVTLAAGDDLLVDATTLGGPVRLEALGPDGVTILRQVGPSTSPPLLHLNAATSATYYVRVSGAAGVLYALEHEVF